MQRETTEEMLAEYHAEAGDHSSGGDLMSQAFLLGGAVIGIGIFAWVMSDGSISPRLAGKMVGYGFMAVVVFGIAVVKQAVS